MLALIVCAEFACALLLGLILLMPLVPLLMVTEGALPLVVPLIYVIAYAASGQIYQRMPRWLGLAREVENPSLFSATAYAGWSWLRLLVLFAGHVLVLSVISSDAFTGSFSPGSSFHYIDLLPQIVGLSLIALSISINRKRLRAALEANYDAAYVQATRRASAQLPNGYSPYNPHDPGVVNTKARKERQDRVAELQKRWGVPVVAGEGKPFAYVPRMPQYDPVKAPLFCDENLPLITNRPAHPGAQAAASNPAPTSKTRSSAEQAL